MSVIAIVLVILALICFAIPAFTRYDAGGHSGQLVPAGLFFVTLAMALPALGAAL